MVELKTRIATWSILGMLMFVGAVAEASDEKSDSNGNGNGKGKGQKPPADEPFPTTYFYFGLYPGCTNAQYCGHRWNDMSREPPISAVAQVESLYSISLGTPYLSWETPWWLGDDVELSGDDVTITIFADAASGASPPGSAIVDLYGGVGGNYEFVGTQRLEYVPGTGTNVPGAIINGRFTASFENVTSPWGPNGDIFPDAWLVQVHRDAAVLTGPFDVRYDGVDSPSCMAINGVGCPV